MAHVPFDQRPPKPGNGWSGDLIALDQAYVVPPGKGDFVQKAGVLHADGAYAPRAALWRKHRPLTLRPDLPSGPLERLEGRWLWGGVLWEHFGHFLVESTSRLWPLPALAGDLDGILFIPKRPSNAKVFRFQQDFARLLGSDLAMRVTSAPLRVERLHVPGQGFGLGDLAAGTRFFRRTMWRHFGRGIAPDGPDKLYISRSRIADRRGALIAEESLETLLAEHGYEIFHPQAHDLPTQVARYKAASTILACEGSALHLLGMTARPDQRIGVIVRRRSSATDSIRTHLNSFSGRAPSVFDALRRNWKPVGQARKHMWHGELDLPLLQAMLRQDGFIGARGRSWPARSVEEIAEMLGQDFVVARHYGPPDAARHAAE